MHLKEKELLIKIIFFKKYINSWQIYYRYCYFHKIFNNFACINKKKRCFDEANWPKESLLQTFFETESVLKVITKEVCFQSFPSLLEAKHHVVGTTWHFVSGVDETGTHHVTATVGFAGGISEIGVRVSRLTWHACSGQTRKNIY